MEHTMHINLCTTSLTAGALAAGLCCTGWADTLHVPADFNTIQEAINAAANGDTVSIAAGTWFEIGIDPGGAGGRGAGHSASETRPKERQHQMVAASAWPNAVLLRAP